MAEKYKDTRYRNATSEGKKITKLYDGNGLFLWLYEDVRKYWRLRCRIHGKEKFEIKRIEEKALLGVSVFFSLPRQVSTTMGPILNRYLQKFFCAGTYLNPKTSDFKWVH